MKNDDISVPAKTLDRIDSTLASVEKFKADGVNDSTLGHVSEARRDIRDLRGSTGGNGQGKGNVGYDGASSNR